MNILILHRIPYQKISYHRGINHQVHRVYYLGTQSALMTIPDDLPCTKWQRPGCDDAYTEALLIMSEQGVVFDRVISLSEYELMAAAQLRDHFSIPGPSVDSVIKVRDKLVMKKCVAQAGLAVPYNMSLDTFLVDGSGLTGPAVLKPVDGASSENVQIYASGQQLREACETGSTGIATLDNRCFSGFEVEEFVEGDILHFDGLVVNGDVKVVIASQYINTCLDYAKGKPLGSFQLTTTDAHRAWVSKILAATDLKDGSFHLEAINTDQGLVFLELANRVGGADVVNTVEYATGVHLPSLELQIYLGEAPQICAERSNEKYGWFVFPGHHLATEYCRIDGEVQYRNDANIIHWHQLAPDAPLKKQITYQAHEVPLAGLLKAESSEDLRAFMASLFSTVVVAQAETESAENC